MRVELASGCDGEEPVVTVMAGDNSSGTRLHVPSFGEHARVMWVVLTIGLAVRLVAAALFHSRQLEGLTVSYFNSAHNLAIGDPFEVSRGVEILHPYGYSVLILAVQIFTGNNDVATIIGLTAIQVVLDTVGILLIFRAACTLHGRRAGVFAATVYAINPMIVLACVQPIPESLSPVLIAGFLAACTAAWRREPRWPLWAGVCCGIALHFRSEFLLLPVVLFTYVALARGLREGLRGVPVMVAVVGLFLSPLVIGTWVETGTPRINTTNSGGTMWQGLGEIPENPWGLHLGDNYVAEEAARQGFPNTWGADANEYFTREFLKDVQEHPLFYLNEVVTLRIPRVFDTKFQRWNYVQYAVGIWQLDQACARYAQLEALGPRQVLLEDPRLFIVSEPVGFAIRGVALTSFAAFLLYIIGYRRRRECVWLLLLPLAYFVVSLCLIKFVEPRQFFCLLPLYTLAMGVVASRVVEPLSGRLRRSAPAGPHRRGAQREAVDAH